MIPQRFIFVYFMKMIFAAISKALVRLGSVFDLASAVNESTANLFHTVHMVCRLTVHSAGSGGFV